jgi:hypothetical protein
MKTYLLVLTFVTFAAAVPTASADNDATFLQSLDDLITPQSGDSTQDEFVEGGCRDIIMIFARGSSESGNMVSMDSAHCVAKSLCFFPIIALDNIIPVMVNTQANVYRKREPKLAHIWPVASKKHSAIPESP